MAVDGISPELTGVFQDVFDDESLAITRETRASDVSG
jgi:hypothetical protein